MTPLPDNPSVFAATLFAAAFALLFIVPGGAQTRPSSRPHTARRPRGRCTSSDAVPTLSFLLRLPTGLTNFVTLCYYHPSPVRKAYNRARAWRPASRPLQEPKKGKEPKKKTIVNRGRVRLADDRPMIWQVFRQSLRPAHPPSLTNHSTRQVRSLRSTPPCRHVRLGGKLRWMSEWAHTIAPERHRAVRQHPGLGDRRRPGFPGNRDGRELRDDHDLLAHVSARASVPPRRPSPTPSSIRAAQRLRKCQGAHVTVLGQRPGVSWRRTDLNLPERHLPMRVNSLAFVLIRSGPSWVGLISHARRLSFKSAAPDFAFGTIRWCRGGGVLGGFRSTLDSRTGPGLGFRCQGHPGHQQIAAWRRVRSSSTIRSCPTPHWLFYPTLYGGTSEAPPRSGDRREG